MKIYTKTGDKGTTSLIGGERVGKDDPRVEAYGSVDELTAFTASLRDNMDSNNPEFTKLRGELRAVLDTLMRIQASLASAKPTEYGRFGVNAESVAQLEGSIDAIHASLEPVTRFTIPGGHPLVSQSHICRTVCRRAERCAVRVSHDFEVDADALKYLNRLSDYFYELGRVLARELGVEEEYWEP